MILKTRSGDRELRTLSPPDFGVRDDFPSAGGPTILTSKTATGIPAFSQAGRMAAEAVASTDLGVWNGKGVDRKAVIGTWQARLFDGCLNDQQTTFEFWETVEESNTFRNNAYIWKNADGGQVTELFALHPDQVVPYQDGRGRRLYQVLVSPWWVDPVGKGTGWYIVDASVVLHIKGFGNGGGWIAPSPVEIERAALGAALAKIEHEKVLYDNSATPSMVVSFAGELTKEQMDDYREQFQAIYGGYGNTGRTAVVGSGATIAKVGLSLADAQFVESMQFDVEQVARILNWEASLLGGGGTAGTGIASGPKTPEHELARLLRHRLIPRFKRIESALYCDPMLFAVGSRDYPMFNTDRALRGDLATEANISLTKVQSGQWTPDEARALDGLPPLPDGSGAIPIHTPVGGAPNEDGGGEAPPSDDTGAPADATASAPGGAKGARALNAAEALQKVYLAVGKVITVEEARRIVNQSGADLALPGPPDLTSPGPDPAPAADAPAPEPPPAEG